jgi:hypothetical protein
MPARLCYTHGVSWQERRYSSWLLEHEQLLQRRQDSVHHIMVALGLVIAITESLLPWTEITPDIPFWAHIAAAAVALPLLYMLWQGDYQRKLQAFSVAMSDRGRRMLFLDASLDSEEFAMQERLQGAHLLPLRRAIDTTLRSAAATSLHARVGLYYSTLPHPVCEGDRMGVLSILHPVAALQWGAALALAWACMAQYGLHIGTSHGLSVLPVLVLLYLYATRANTRFAFEAALYDWLRLG